MNKFQIAHRNATIKMHQSALRVELARHPEVAATLKMFPPKLRSEVRLNISEYNNTVQFAVVLIDLDSFKDKALTKLIAKFAGDEWGSQTNDYTYDDKPNRDYHFTRRVAWTPKPSKHTRWLEANGSEYPLPTTFEIVINIFAYVKSDSPLCRVVVTGFKEEVTRKEIKQIVCA